MKLHNVLRFLFVLILVAPNMSSQVQVPYAGSTNITVTTTGLPSNCTQGTPTLSASSSTITVPVSCTAASPPSQACVTQVKPTGGDDHNSLWSAMSTAIAAKSCLEILPGNYSTSPLNPPPGTLDIRFDDGVIVTDRPGYGNYDQLFAITSGNSGTWSAVGPLKNAVLTMPNSYAKNIQSSDQNVNQYNNCIWVSGASNVTVTGLHFDKCGGDSFYVANATHVIFRGNISTNPIRNGFSVTDGLNDVLIDGNDLSGAVNCAKAGICDGGDVEPNTSGTSVAALKVTNNKFHDNSGTGLCLCLYFTSSTTPIGITVSGNSSDRNGKLPYDANGPNKGNWNPKALSGTVGGAGNLANGKPSSFPASL